MPVHPVELPPPMNHVFLDFENVHTVDLSIIGRKHICFTLLVGAKQTRIDATLVEKLLEHAASAHLVRLTSSGKNALDLTLAYYLGRAVLADPTAYFHIVSKDTHFDPLIEHLRSRHIHVHRHNDFTTLTFGASPKSSSSPAKPVAPPAENYLPRVLENLRKSATGRPKKEKTLRSRLGSLFGVGTSEEVLTSLIEKLVDGGHIKIGEKGAVTYNLIPADSNTSPIVLLP